MTTIPGPVWYWVSASAMRGTVGALLEGIAARGATHDVYWQVGTPPAWSMARALASAPLVGKAGFRERFARGGSVSSEKRNLLLCRPDARWRDKRSPSASAHVVMKSALDHEDAEILARLDPKGRVGAIRVAASIVFLGDAKLQAPLVFAALATLEDLAPNGYAWFNHELMCARSREATDIEPPALFKTTSLTLADVEGHESRGQGSFFA